MSLKLKRVCRTERDQGPACTFFEAPSAEAVEGSGRRAALGFNRIVEATTTRGWAAGAGRGSEVSTIGTGRGAGS
jgi:hypothetical protein